MRPRRLSPILPEQAFLHNTFLCLSSLTLNYSKYGYISEVTCFVTRISMRSSVHRTNPAACLRELCVLVWDGLRTMEYKLFMASYRG